MVLWLHPAQVASTLIAVLGFGGYTWPRERVHPCRFCQLSSGGNVPFFERKAPLAHTESVFTDSTIGCTCAAPQTLYSTPLGAWAASGNLWSCEPVEIKFRS